MIISPLIFSFLWWIKGKVNYDHLEAFNFLDNLFML